MTQGNKDMRAEFPKLTLDFELDADFFSSNHLFASMTALLDISPAFTSRNKKRPEDVLSHRLVQLDCTVYHQLHTTCQSIVTMPTLIRSEGTGMIYNPRLDDIY